MGNIRRRLQKLEARLTDSSGFVPKSQQWWDYWLPKVDRILSGADPDRIPLEVVDAIIAAGTEKSNSECS